LKVQVDIEGFQRILGSRQESGFLLGVIRDLKDHVETEDLYNEVKGIARWNPGLGGPGNY
jgi:hypothetical protein